MTELLYLKDCYLREFDAKIVDVLNEGVVLDKTAFYVSGGGQPGDNGKLIVNGREYVVDDVVKRDGKVVHIIKDEQGLEPGMTVRGVINWERRYKLMRMHTAAHILSGLIFEKYNSLVTGNQLGIEKSRIDFDLEKLGEDDLRWLGEEANRIIGEGKEIRIEFLPAEKAFEIPQIFKLKHILPKNLKEIRVVRIDGIDASACGGTHVKNTKEIGSIKILKKESRGREHKRIYFTVVESQ
jgi:Ser-tRNA(Ala) deacylase AlaX